MRKFLAVLSAAALALVGSTSLVAAAGDPFTKSWSATDVDGSVTTLAFDGVGDTRTVSLADSRATFCEGSAYAATGSGTIDGNAIAVEFAGACVDDGRALPPFTLVFVYQPASATLTDGSLTYRRGNTARDAFIGVWKATDLDGSALKLTFRGSGLERDVSYLDDLASSCDPNAPFYATGIGVIGSTPGWGRYITVALEGGCVGGAPIVVPDLMYRYDVATDTLRGPLDLSGNEIVGTFDWYRG